MKLATPRTKDKSVDELVRDQQTSTILLYSVLPIFFNCMCLSPGQNRGLQIMIFTCKFTGLNSGFADSGGSGHCGSRNMIRLEEGRMAQITTDGASLRHTACTARRIFWVAVLVIVCCCVECNLYMRTVY